MKPLTRGTLKKEEKKKKKLPTLEAKLSIAPMVEIGNPRRPGRQGWGGNRKKKTLFNSEAPASREKIQRPSLFQRKDNLDQRVTHSCKKIPDSGICTKGGAQDQRQEEACGTIQGFRLERRKADWAAISHRVKKNH